MGYENSLGLGFSRPARPINNAKVEPFNGQLRQECLNAHRFPSLADAQRKIEARRQYYNEARPQSALCSLAPGELARQRGARPALTGEEEPEIST